MPRCANRILPLVMMVWAAGCAGEGASPGAIRHRYSGGVGRYGRGNGGNDRYRRGIDREGRGRRRIDWDGRNRRPIDREGGGRRRNERDRRVRGEWLPRRRRRPRWRRYRRVYRGARVPAGPPAGRAALRARAAPELRIGACTTALPARARAADVSTPTTVVGTGTPASCTFAALQAAATKGGVITFDCGAGTVTIAVTATLELPINKNTVIDGGNQITLDGGHAVQILRFDSANFRATDFGLTLQHLTLANGKTTPTEAIPTAPGACSQGWNDGEGGAHLHARRHPHRHRLDLRRQPGRAARPRHRRRRDLRPGQQARRHDRRQHLHATTAASNAGAVGGLFAELDIYNSLFENNHATGHDANNNDPTMCSAMNNGQNEIGSGGNGGAIYSDGNAVDVILCGDAILNNAAGTNAFGGGLFFTSNNFGGNAHHRRHHDDRQHRRPLDPRAERQRHQRRHRRRHQLQEHHHHQLDDAGPAMTD